MEKAEFEAEIARLAGIEYVDYCRESKAAAKQLGITKRELDRCVKDAERKAIDEQSAESEVDQFTGIKLGIGSDLEIARLCINDMFANDGRYVFRKAHSIIGQVASGLN